MLSKNTHTSKHVVCDFVYIIDVGTEDPVAGPKQCGSYLTKSQSTLSLNILSSELLNAVGIMEAYLVWLDKSGQGKEKSH